MKSTSIITALVTFSLSAAVLTACGVKGPPLPPIVVEPKESEEKTFLPVVTPIPSPTASPTATPKSTKAKSKKKKGT